MVARRRRSLGTQDLAVAAAWPSGTALSSSSCLCSMRLEAVTGRRTGLDTVSRSCFTAESPAGNPATRCLVHGPEALRHCLATVLPITVFRRYMPRLVTRGDYNRGRVNPDTTNGLVRPTSGLSCGSQHP